MARRRALVIGRRDTIGVLGAGAVGAAALLAQSHLIGTPLPPVSPKPLRWHAARRGMSFGIAVMGPELRDPAALRLIAAEADLIQPMNALKWRVVEAQRGRPDYTLAEAIIAAGEQQHLRLRGHAGFWYMSEPDWAPPVMAGPQAHDVIIARVAAVVGRFRGRIAEWDVINEVVNPAEGMPSGLRRAPFGRPVDAGLYADCFHAARAADPGARLFCNETGIESDWAADEAQRRALLAFLTDLKKRGAPIDGLGCESHLATYRSFSPRVFRDFLGEVAALCLTIRLTELDVADNKTRGSIAARDAAVADYAQRYLDAAFDERAVEGLTVWGFRNGESWLQTAAWAKRSDGTPLRPLPFNDSLGRTPLWSAIARAYDGAPAR